jgi:DNA-binding MarR family transcriptional regulator
MVNTLPSIIQDRNRDPELLTWYRFIRVLRKIVHLMDETMQTFDISRAQLDLLIQVAFDEGINQQSCAERMNVTKGNVAQHIGRLEKQGLLTRQKEGRTNHLYLTKDGKEIVAEIMPRHDERVKEILSVLSAEEFKQFQSVIRILDHKIE